MVTINAPVMRKNLKPPLYLYILLGKWVQCAKIQYIKHSFPSANQLQSQYLVLFGTFILQHRLNFPQQLLVFSVSGTGYKSMQVCVISILLWYSSKHVQPFSRSPTVHDFCQLIWLLYFSPFPHFSLKKKKSDSPSPLCPPGAWRRRESGYQ